MIERVLPPPTPTFERVIDPLHTCIDRWIDRKGERGGENVGFARNVWWGKKLDFSVLSLLVLSLLSHCIKVA